MGMTRIGHDGQVETVWCEQCGELPVEVRLPEVGLCHECVAGTLAELAGDKVICGQYLTINGGTPGAYHALCIERYGTEHDHG